MTGYHTHKNVISIQLHCCLLYLRTAFGSFSVHITPALPRVNQIQKVLEFCERSLDFIISYDNIGVRKVRTLFQEVKS